MRRMTRETPPAGEISAGAERGTNADVASLRPVFAPESVVVIGASRRREAIGRVILENIRRGGYAGRLYTVHPQARQINGDRCLASVLGLPEPADLAVIAVPAPAVLGVAEQCGQRGVRSLVVITSGLDAMACADLLAVCRRHGMRLIGPGCFGVAVPARGLDATFAASPLRPGVAGLMSQSGGVGVALAGQLSRLGVGISSFASAGGKLDVSGDDMLTWWEHDGVTRLAVLCLESFGNPRKFARTARRVGARMPVLTVRPGHCATGQALFEQAGVIAARSVGELAEAAALLATQPVPAGPTVAIVSNAGGAGDLAAGACASHGLTVHQPRGLTRRRLRTLLPGGTVTGPVGTAAAVCAGDFRRCLELLAADDGVDAMIALVLPTGATGDLMTVIQDADIRVPLAVVALDQAEAVRLMPGQAGDGQIPVYAAAEAAAAALGHAARYGAWRTARQGQVPRFPDVRAAAARTLVTGFLRRQHGGWLPPEATAELLRCYGIPLADGGPAASEGEAAGAAPVRQPATSGTSMRIRVTGDRVFGPLVVLGPGGHAARLTPLTDTDADALIRIAGAQRLPGQAGAPASNPPALRELLLRVSRLADDLPEVTELDLSPVISWQQGARAMDARVKVAPCPPHDPFLQAALNGPDTHRRRPTTQAAAAHEARVHPASTP
jgi:acyl-CoA synthetase (NDP forming)